MIVQLSSSGKNVITRCEKYRREDLARARRRSFRPFSVSFKSRFLLGNFDTPRQLDEDDYIVRSVEKKKKK